jgi:hypothetical protein
MLDACADLKINLIGPNLEQAMNIAICALICGIAIASPSIARGASLTGDQASQHVGEVASVCGTVASSTYAAQSRGQPTFLNLDRPYPNETFTIVIWGEDRPRFGAPEAILSGKRVCATGVIQTYRGRPEIILRDPGQLQPE